MNTTSQIEYFLRFFMNEDGLSQLKKEGLLSGYDTMDIRSVAWKIFLGLLKGTCSKDWIEQTKRSREKYEVLVRKLENGPIRTENIGELIQQQGRVADPLSREAGDPWNEHFKEKDVEKKVSVDIVRLFSEYDFFKNEEVRKQIQRVCVVYSLEHNELQYNQGFHELVGVLFYGLSKDMQGWKMTKEVLERIKGKHEKYQMLYEVMSCLFDEKYIEHDAYDLFDLLMKTVQDFYDPSETRNSIIESPDGSATHTKLMVRCEYLFNKLERLDNQLYLHLKYEGIHLVLFGTRWLRLLFDREFPVMDVLNVWDAIFAYGNNLEFVNYLFLAMLVFVREQILLSSQYSTTMMILMKYPEIMDIRDLLQLALDLSIQKDDYPPYPYIKPNSQQITPQKVGEIQTKMKKKLSSKDKKRKEASPLPPEEKKKEEDIEVKVEQIKVETQKKKEVMETNELIQERISHSIQLLSKAINNEGVVSDPQCVVQALSELKLVNAVVSGLLPNDTAENYFKVFDKEKKDN